MFRIPEFPLCACFFIYNSGWEFFFFRLHIVKHVGDVRTDHTDVLPSHPLS